MPALSYPLRIPFGRHRGLTREDLIRSYPSYALWADRNAVSWLKPLTDAEARDCKIRCLMKHGLPARVEYWESGCDYDRAPNPYRLRYAGAVTGRFSRRAWADNEDADYIDDMGGPW